MTIPSEKPSSTTVSWTRPDDQLSSPVVSHIPYIELKLVHPELEETQFGNAFFPEAIPYQIDDEHRVFYWRPSLPALSPDVETWIGVCATTHELTPIVSEAVATPCLWRHRGDTYEVVVDGTVAGESLTIEIYRYQSPAVMIHRITPDQAELEAVTKTMIVPDETRTTVQLPEQSVAFTDQEEGETFVEPRLHVRYPGQRTVYHPAPEARYALFPSFGLDIDTIPNPATVPVTDGELDHIDLASGLGVDLSDRPYSERILWQAFAYQVFDPRRETCPQLTQSRRGLLLLGNPRF